MENVALRCELSLSRHKYLVDHLSRTLVWHFKLLFFVLFFLKCALILTRLLVCSTIGTGSQTLYFAVKFYAVDPCKLVEELTR